MACIPYCSHAAVFENDWKIQLVQNAVTRLPMKKKRFSSIVSAGVTAPISHTVNFDLQSSTWLSPHVAPGGKVIL